MTAPCTDPSALRRGPAGPRGLGARAAALVAGLGEGAISPAVAAAIASAFEAIILAGMTLAAVGLWLGAPGHAFWPIFGSALATVMSLRRAGVYSVGALRRPQTRVARAIATWTVVVAVFAMVLLLAGLKADLPRSWFAVWYLSGIAALVVAGVAMASEVRRQAASGRLQRRVVIVGGGASTDALVDELERSARDEIRILGLFDDRDDSRLPAGEPRHPKLGAVADLVDFARLTPIDLVIVSIPPSAETRLLQILKQLWVLPVDIRLAANASRLRLRPRSYSHIGSVPLLDVFDKPIAGWDQVAKRTFDLVVTSLALVVLAPVLAAVALAVRLDSPGPVLFRQRRYGFNNEVIEVLKFRSMFHDKADPTARQVVTRGDPRVTRVGRFIRRTSLDELPQLLNVLRGDLSLVGPRPHAVNAHTRERLWEEVVDGYFARHRVKPGVTGWAQVNGLRGEVDSPEKIRARVDHDLHYIENWSVAFDLYILLLTPVRILDQESAY